MKNLLFVILSFLLFACTDEYILNANLSIVEDEVESRIDEISKDTFYARRVSLHYFAINKSRDSIFIPIGYPCKNPIRASIESRDSLKTSFYLEHCNILNKKDRHKKAEQQSFAVGDTISIAFYLYVSSKNRMDSEWLERTPTKELISRIHLDMVKPTNVKDADKIPNVIFNNDTNDININPTIGDNTSR